jgi:L-methionine (R)-S-oxide reductase
MSQQQYDRVFKTLDSLCEGEADPIAVMATIACELYATFDKFNWVGFYRNVGNRTLKIGPYQGAHGCLTIPFDKGVCGKCAREKIVQNVPDVTKAPHHIACSATTQSELVVPILSDHGELVAVLDIDSDTRAAFTEIDERNLNRINKYFRAEFDEAL